MVVIGESASCAWLSTGTAQMRNVNHKVWCLLSSGKPTHSVSARIRPLDDL